MSVNGGGGGLMLSVFVWSECLGECTEILVSNPDSHKQSLFWGLHKLQPHSDWSLLGGKFKISAEHPHPFHIGVPRV